MGDSAIPAPTPDPPLLPSYSPSSSSSVIKATRESQVEQDNNNSAQQQTFPKTPNSNHNNNSKNNTFFRWRWTIILHFFGCFIYLLPLTTHPYELNHPVLDELHVCSADNVDVNGPLPSSLWEIFQHDYWGRPMTAENSHKSWRPFTILSFRYLGGGGGRPVSNHDPLTTYANRWMSTLTLHRLVNVILHAATADLVAVVATRLFPPLSLLGGGGSTTTTTFILYVMVKLLFLLHPTHVEVTANAANRNHLLATMCSLILILLMQQQQQQQQEFLGVALLFLVLLPVTLLFGFGASETFLFQIPAILVTATVLEFVRQQQQQQKEQEQLIARNQTTKNDETTTTTTINTTTAADSSSSFQLFLSSLWKLRFRHLMVILGAAAYAFGRHYFDTLKIPEGLLRPAENPFANLTGWKRIWNYAYVTALHVMKSLGLDVIGFSHEYGERCIEPLRLRKLYPDDDDDDGGDKNESGMLVPEDFRIALPMVLAVLLVVVTMACISRALSTTTTTIANTNESTKAKDQNDTNDEQHMMDSNANNNHHDIKTINNSSSSSSSNLFPLLLWLMHLSWLITLFPIMGFVKVGTFVSDRIVVPSTVSVCILFGAALTKLLALTVSHSKRSKKSTVLAPLVVGMILMFSFMWRRIHIRSLQWMDSVPLLLSSLQTCPNFAKGHLEISKVYSGLYPAHFNLTRSRWHLQQVERIDSTFCDVHQQFAHVALQELNYVEFEERLVQAMLCPFTMGGAVEMWKRYWQAVLGPNTPEPQRIQAQIRQNRYSQQIQKAVAEQQKEQ